MNDPDSGTQSRVSVQTNAYEKSLYVLQLFSNALVTTGEAPMTMLKIRGSNTDPDKERCRQALAPLADEFGQFEIEWLGNGGCSVESDDIPPDKMAAFAAAIKAALGANYRLTLTANF